MKQANFPTKKYFFSKHIGNCAYNTYGHKTCGYCTNQYPPNGEADHNANCLQFLKYENSILKSKIEDLADTCANLRYKLAAAENKQ